MKTNKYLLLVISVITAVYTLFGCNSGKHQQYESVICDTANDSTNIEVECNYWTGVYFIKDHMPSASCEVMGIVYSGDYKQSIVDKLNSYTTNIYMDANRIEFGIRDDTGELVFINFMNAQFFDTEPFLNDIENAQEMSLSLSRQVASNYVNDLNEYEQIIENPITRYKEKDGANYEITYFITTFARKIDQYYTSDYISIKVTSKGNIASIMIGDLNAFSNIKEISFDASTAEQSVKNKISTVYTKAGYSIVQTEVADRKMARTPNGEICIYSIVELTVDDCQEEYMKTAVGVLTFLNHS